MLCFLKRGQWRSTTYSAQSIVRVFACRKRHGLVLSNDFLIHACDTPTFILVLEIFRNAFFLSGTMRLLFTSERRIHSVWFAHGRGGDWGPEKWLLQKTPQSNKHKGNVQRITNVSIDLKCCASKGKKKHLPLIHFDTCFTLYGFHLLPFHMKWLQLLFKLTFGLIALTTEWWNSQHLPFPFQGMGREIYPLKWNGSSWYDEVYYTRTTTNRQWTNRHSLQVIRHPWQTTSETSSSKLGVSLESSVQVSRLKLCCTEYA